jgi:DNA-binding PadR family transcriptional regulator
MAHYALVSTLKKPCTKIYRGLTPEGKRAILSTEYMKESYKVPFYILGFLRRFGPMHGYQIKKYMEEQASDFAKIKMSNLYYHLGVMCKNNLIELNQDQDTTRPEREIYKITKIGEKKFIEYYKLCLDDEIDFIFPIDGVFFFSNLENIKNIETKLLQHKEKNLKRLKILENHKKEVEAKLSNRQAELSKLIFLHHEVHYKAELQWIEMAINQLGKNKHKSEEELK